MLRWVTPNHLTLLRIFSIPVVLALVYPGRPATNFAAVGVFGLACITDYWDGVLARKRGEITHLGKLLDPIADKMLIMSVLILLVWMNVADVIPAILITMREFAIGGLRSVAATEGIVISASPGAKWKTVLQMFAVGFLIINHNPFGLPVHAFAQGLLWFAAAWTLWTGYAYFLEYYRSNPTK